MRSYLKELGVSAYNKTREVEIPIFDLLTVEALFGKKNAPSMQPVINTLSHYLDHELFNDGFGDHHDRRDWRKKFSMPANNAPDVIEATFREVYEDVDQGRGNTIMSVQMSIGLLNAVLNNPTFNILTGNLNNHINNQRDPSGNMKELGPQEKLTRVQTLEDFSVDALNILASSVPHPDDIQRRKIKIT